MYDYSYALLNPRLSFIVFIKLNQEWSRSLYILNRIQIKCFRNAEKRQTYFSSNSFWSNQFSSNPNLMGSDEMDWTKNGRTLKICLTTFANLSPDSAIAGDVIVLTKPLGTQVAINALHWLEQPALWDQVKHVVSEADVRKAYQRAMACMSRLNKKGEMNYRMRRINEKGGINFFQWLNQPEIQAGGFGG